MTINHKIYPVILSGGVGSRLWPLSRKKSPKQFIPLIDNHNLLQSTYLRYVDEPLCEKPIIVCNEDHRFQVAESLRALEVENATIILEPEAKNTAPAIALAALAVLEKEQDPFILVSPSDHYVNNFKKLFKILAQARLESEYLYTFGIQPSSAETGYGYIKVGSKRNDTVYDVISFIEKPNKESAKAYLKEGSYYWNSGIFLFKATTYLKQLEVNDPKTYQSCVKSFNQKQKDLDFIRIDAETFSHCADISVDYAIMEKAKKIAVIPIEQLKWSDIGSWKALFDLANKDQNGNIVKGDIYQVNTKNCYLHSHDRLLATAGIDSLVVVETADAILVADASHTQEIKALVSKLKLDNRQEVIKHKRHYAPWGYSDQIAKGDNFIVNKLYFKANAKSSLRMHYHRSEYFTVLSGAIKVLINDQTYLLSQGMSINILPLQKHQVIAIGQLPAEMLEIQSGAYLSDDDIERFEEVY
ncbi:mannose-1-phosphate guanylyltransferase/mannose-6-phosphate isomerase [Thiotrichales bacterium 19S3-7]|nr:mannose-1-phosphate guanylyltransferase/mannose-6-phosphate isomerase [Thiotrichales bacterium 19S3-7]MCF6800696.1 mannose-1-phosphate guanylyltransferase/mannose-6-phosphate isomerase [Thiotrichales bacterium 19S3-11]